MSKKAEFSKEIKKRKSRLDHATQDLKEISEELTKRGPNAPPFLVAEVNAAKPKLDKASKTFVHSSIDVDAFTSAVSDIQQSPAISGIKVQSGSYRAKRESNVDERARRDFISDWKEKHDSRRRGWQSELANDFATKFGLTFEGARSYLKSHDYFTD